MYANGQQAVQFPGMPMNAQPAPTISIAGAQFPAGGGQALNQPGPVNALANYYRSQPGGPMPGTRPMLPAPGGEGPTNLAPTGQPQGLGQMSPQVQALMRQYQSNQALQARLALAGQPGVAMQQGGSNILPAQQAALAQQMQPMAYQSQMNPQAAPMQQGMPAQGAAAMGNLPPGALGLARYYQR